MKFEILKDVLQIFGEVYKISTKNGRITALILAVTTILVNSMIYLINFFSTKPLIGDLFVKQMSLILTPPNSPEFIQLLIGIKDDVKIFLGVEGIITLMIPIASVILSTATVLAAALLYGGKYISPKDLVQKTTKSLKRPFITWFYTNLFFTGYVFMFLSILLPLLLIVDRPGLFKPISVMLTILAFIFYAYLLIAWNLAFIVSVLEDRSGIEALGKAAQIAKGMKLKGFVLNLAFIFLSVFLFLGHMKLLFIISPLHSTFVSVSIVLIEVAASSLIRITVLVAYTVLYYKCKTVHEEEVELEDSAGTLEYVKVANTPLVNENVP